MDSSLGMQLRSLFDSPASPSAAALAAHLAPLVAGFAAVIDHDRVVRPGLAVATADIASLSGITAAAEAPTLATLEVAATDLSRRVSAAAACADVAAVAAVATRFAGTVAAYQRAQQTFDQTRAQSELPPGASALATHRPVRSVMTVQMRHSSTRPTGHVR